jgi:hypothetical protein
MLSLHKYTDTAEVDITARHKGRRTFDVTVKEVRYALRMVNWYKYNV